MSGARVSRGQRSAMLLGAIFMTLIGAVLLIASFFADR
jgi:hypothetical protein